MEGNGDFRQYCRLTSSMQPSVATVLPQALTYKVSWCIIHRNPQETRQKCVTERVIGQTELTDCKFYWAQLPVCQEPTPEGRLLSLYPPRIPLLWNTLARALDNLRSESRLPEQSQVQVPESSLTQPWANLAVVDGASNNDLTGNQVFQGVRLAACSRVPKC